MTRRRPFRRRFNRLQLTSRLLSNRCEALRRCRHAQLYSVDFVIRIISVPTSNSSNNSNNSNNSTSRHTHQLHRRLESVGPTTSGDWVAPTRRLRLATGSDQPRRRGRRAAWASTDRILCSGLSASDSAEVFVSRVTTNRRRFVAEVIRRRFPVTSCPIRTTSRCRLTVMTSSGCRRRHSGFCRRRRDNK